MHAVHLNHLLTPGSPGYAALKLGAVASVFGLQFALRRRAGRGHEDAAEPVAATDEPARRSPHPRSKKKRRRRRP
jgi:hypothetical protein